MKPEHQIKVGDIVSVNFHAAQSTLCHRAEVCHVPLAPPHEDAWVFLDLQTKDVHHVFEPCTVTKHS